MSKENKVIMFTTPDCSACKIIIPLVEGKGLPIEIVDATQEPERAAEHSVMSVPTFASEDAEGNHVETLAVGQNACVKFVNEFEV